MLQAPTTPIVDSTAPSVGCDPELLNLLCCPETHQSLSLADEALVQKLNQSIEAGRLKSRNGKRIREKIQAALLRADGALLFPIRHNIPIMLMDEAIELNAV